MVLSSPYTATRLSNSQGGYEAHPSPGPRSGPQTGYGSPGRGPPRKRALRRVTGSETSTAPSSLVSAAERQVVSAPPRKRRARIETASLRSTVPSALGSPRRKKTGGGSRASAGRPEAKRRAGSD